VKGALQPLLEHRAVDFDLAQEPRDGYAMMFALVADLVIGFEACRG
jgi:hypothetical protein